MRTALLFILALLIPSSAKAEESLETIRKALKRTEQAVCGIECSYISLNEQKENPIEVHDPSLVANRKRHDKVKWSLGTNGDGSVESTSYVTDTALDGTVRNYVEVLSATRKDGTQRESRTIDGTPKPVSVRRTSQLKVRHFPPTEMATHFLGHPVSEWITSQSLVVAEEQWESRPVEVLEVTKDRGNPQARMFLWVDVERGSVVRRFCELPIDEGKPVVIDEWSGTQWKEVLDGVWFPTKVRRLACPYGGRL